MGKGGLAFLQKKKWHPGTFKNIERTWAAQEESERQEKQKQLNIVKLKEERYLEGLKRLQVQEGLIPSSALDRMPWMYEFGNKIQDSKSAEEFLTGRTITKADLDAEQEDQQRFKAVVQEEKGNQVCEEFNRLHEDPLFQIRQEELKQQQQILSNPIQMKNIYEELKQKVKKDKQKHQKHRHHRHSKSRSPTKKDEKAKKKLEKQQRKQDKKDKKALKKQEKNQQNNDFYEDYLKKRLGANIVAKDTNGKLRLDFNYYKRKLNTSMITKKQLTQQEQLQMVEQMKQRAEQLRKDKIELYEKDQQKSHKEESKNTLRNPEFLQKTRKEIQKLNEEQDISEIMGRNRNNYLQHLDRKENTFKK